MKCPAVPQPSNGNLSPPECAFGIRYPGTCSIRCNSGYNNVGPSRISCQSTGSFLSNVANVGCGKGKCMDAHDLYACGRRSLPYTPSDC